MDELLLDALMNSDTVAFDSLIAGGAKLIEKGESALLVAIRYQKISMVRHILSKYDIDLQHRNADGHHALSLAVSLDDEDSTALLLAYGFPIDFPLGDGRTARVFAEESSTRKNVLSLLIAAEELIEIASKESKDCSRLNETLIPLTRCVIEMDAKDSFVTVISAVNARRMKDGCTSLHAAILYKNKVLVKSLLENSASLFLQNSVGFSPLDYAKFFDNNQIKILMYIAHIERFNRRVEDSSTFFEKKYNLPNKKEKPPVSPELQYTLENIQKTIFQIEGEEKNNIYFKVGTLFADPQAPLFNPVLAYNLLTQAKEKKLIRKASAVIFKLLIGNHINFYEPDIDIVQSDLRLLKESNGQKDFLQLRIIIKYLLASNLKDKSIMGELIAKYVLGDEYRKLDVADITGDNIPSYMAIIEKLRQAGLLLRNIKNENQRLHGILNPEIKVTQNLTVPSPKLMLIKPPAPRVSPQATPVKLRFCSFRASSAQTSESELTASSKSKPKTLIQNAASSSSISSSQIQASQQVAEISLDEKLLAAVTAGNIKEIDNLVAAGANLEYKHEWRSMLAVATFTEKTKTVDHLIKRHGCKVNDAFIDNLIWNNLMTMLDHFVHQHSYNIRERKASSLLSIALRNESIQMFDHLIARYGCNKAEKIIFDDDTQGSLMHLAVLEGKQAMLDNLIDKHGFNITEKIHGDGQTAIHLAVIRNNIKMLDHLINRYHCDVNQGDARGRTALHLAAMHGKTDIIRFLLGQGICINSLDDEGTSAFRYCKRNSDAFKLLEAANNLLFPPDATSREYLRENFNYLGSLVNARRNKDGCTALHIAILQNNSLMVEELLDHGVPLSLLNNQKQSSFELASASTNHYINALVNIANIKYLLSSNDEELSLSYVHFKKDTESKEDKTIHIKKPINITMSAREEQINDSLETVLRMIKQCDTKNKNSLILKFDFFSSVLNSTHPHVVYNFWSQINNKTYIKKANTKMYRLLIRGSIVLQSTGIDKFQAILLSESHLKESSELHLLRLKFIIQHLLASSIKDKSIVGNFIAEYALGSEYSISGIVAYNKRSGSILMDLMECMQEVQVSIRNLSKENEELKAAIVAREARAQASLSSTIAYSSGQTHFKPLSQTSTSRDECLHSSQCRIM